MALNTGRYLETLVALIQETLKDSINTKIYTNAKLPNRSGRKREFDILIETTISSFLLKIAIECKDYNKPISVDKIEAFQGKCSRWSDINKKVFVSSARGYQKDAINAAKEFGIDLFKIEEIDSATIFKWFTITQLGLRFQIKDYKLGIDCTDEELKSIHNQEEVTFIYKNSARDITAFLNEHVKQAAAPIWNINTLELMRGKGIGTVTNIPFRFEFVNEAFVKTKNNTLFPISELLGSIDTFLIESKSDNVTSKSFSSNDKTLAHYIAFEDGKFGKAEIVITADKRKFFHVDLEGNRVELKELAVYDPKTDTYTLVPKDNNEDDNIIIQQS